MPARKSTASKATKRRKPVARRPRSTKARRGGVYEFGSRHWRCKIAPGELSLTAPDGSEWEPAACGVHRSVPIAERASDEQTPAAAGFDPKCDECQVQATAASEIARQHATV